MDKQEYREIVTDIRRAHDRKEYDKVLMYADELDLKRVSDSRILEMISDAYCDGGDLQTARELLLRAYEKTPMGRKMAYKLSELCIRLGDLDGAVEFYEDFTKMSPNDNDRYLLKYKIGKAGHVAKKDLAKVLAAYCAREVDEKWMAELAELYAEIGDTERCNEVCDDIILWFADGVYVRKALEMKQKNGPLSPAQESKLADLIAEEEAEKAALLAEQEAERQFRPGSIAADGTPAEDDLDAILGEYITIEDATAPPEPVDPADIAEVLPGSEDDIEFEEVVYDTMSFKPPKREKPARKAERKQKEENETEVIPVQQILEADIPEEEAKADLEEAVREAKKAAAVEAALCDMEPEQAQSKKEEEELFSDSFLEELDLETAPFHEEVREKIAENIDRPEPEEVPDILSGSYRSLETPERDSFGDAEIVFANTGEVTTAEPEAAPEPEQDPLLRAVSPNGRPFSNIEAMQSARTAPPKDDASFWRIPDTLSMEEEPVEEEFAEPVYGSHRWFEEKKEPEFEEPVFGAHRYIAEPVVEGYDEQYDENVEIEQVEPEAMAIESAEEDLEQEGHVPTIRTTSSGAELMGIYAEAKKAGTADHLSEQASLVKKPALGGKKLPVSELFAAPAPEPEDIEEPEVFEEEEDLFVPPTEEEIERSLAEVFDEMDEQIDVLVEEPEEELSDFEKALREFDQAQAEPEPAEEAEPEETSAPEPEEKPVLEFDPYWSTILPDEKLMPEMQAAPEFFEEEAEREAVPEEEVPEEPEEVFEAELQPVPEVVFLQDDGGDADAFMDAQIDALEEAQAEPEAPTEFEETIAEFEFEHAAEDDEEEAEEAPAEPEEIRPRPFLFRVQPNEMVEEVVPDIVKERLAAEREAEEAAKAAAEAAAAEPAEEAAAEAEIPDFEAMLAEFDKEAEPWDLPQEETHSEEAAAEPSVFIPLNQISEEEEGKVVTPITEKSIAAAEATAEADAISIRSELPEEELPEAESVEEPIEELIEEEPEEEIPEIPVEEAHEAGFERGVQEFELGGADSAGWDLGYEAAEPQVEEAPIIEITASIPQVEEEPEFEEPEGLIYPDSFLAEPEEEALMEERIEAFEEAQKEEDAPTEFEETVSAFEQEHLEEEFDGPELDLSAFFPDALPEAFTDDEEEAAEIEEAAEEIAEEIPEETPELSDFEKAMLAFEQSQDEAEDDFDLSELDPSFGIPEEEAVEEEMEPVAEEAPMEAAPVEEVTPEEVFEEATEEPMEEPAAEEETLPEPEEEIPEEPEPEAAQGYQIPDEMREELSEFLLIDGMEERICNTIGGIIARKREGDPTGGHLIVTGDAKSGKTYLIISMIKAVGREIGSISGRVAKVQAEALNGKDMNKVFGKIKGSDLIIENAGYLHDDTVQNLIDALQNTGTSSMIVLEGNRLGVENLLTKHPELKDIFHTRMNISELSLAEWADQACAYAKKRGYKVGDMALLALHAKIDEINLPTTRLVMEDIEAIIDKAIAKADKRLSGRFPFGGRKGRDTVRELDETDFM